MFLNQICCGIILTHYFVDIEQKERCLRQFFLGKLGLVPFLDLLKVENGLPLRVRLVGNSEVIFPLFSNSIDVILQLVEFSLYETLIIAIVLFIHFMINVIEIFMRVFDCLLRL